MWTRDGAKGWLLMILAAPALSAPLADCRECISISAIQGVDVRSPYAGQTVTTRGIVTFWSADHKNYWLQDAAGDGDPMTSDAVMVQYRATQNVRPDVGDLLQLSAVVEDYESANGLPVTRLAPANELVVIAKSQALPAAMEIKSVPHENIQETIRYWRSLEGMRVIVRSVVVVGPTDAGGEFVCLPREDNGIVDAPRHALVTSVRDEVVDYHFERLFVAAKPLQLAPLKVGDRLTNVTGVVDYRRNQYKILAQSAEIESLVDVPVYGPRNTAGEFSVATLNAENLFDTVDDPVKDDDLPTPAQLEIKLNKLTQLIVEVLRTPAILVVQEIENQAILQVLGDRVNAKAKTRYAATSFESSDARGIEVGILWDARKTQLVRAQSLTQALFVEMTGESSAVTGREPLLTWFRAGDRDLAVVGVHLKSKLGDDALFGARQPPLRFTEDQRKAQARALRLALDHLSLAYPNAAWIVAGDFNDFSFAEPGEGVDHPLAIVRGATSRLPLTEATDGVPSMYRYTYLHEGNAQQLDHLLIDEKVRPMIAAVNILHANADFPAAWARDGRVPWRASDHDVIELRLHLPSAANSTANKAAAIVVTGFEWPFLLWIMVRRRLRRHR